MTIAEYRKQVLNWTTIEAAAKLGVSRQQLWKWETQTPSGETLMKIAKVYGCKICVTPSGQIKCEKQ